uniref:Uncharacterized protein n=1 Tax=Anguilla anguilla TaxID=7936 RepID=A0A0E9TS94_ANGAN
MKFQGQTAKRQVFGNQMHTLPEETSVRKPNAYITGRDK